MMRTLTLALSLAFAFAHAVDAQTRSRPERPTESPTEPLPEVEPPVFFGEPVTSKRVAFVIDVSGSMSQALDGRRTVRASALRRGTGGARGSSETRLDRVKRELLAVIAALPATATFNVHWFQSTVGAWRRKLTAASPKNRNAARAFVTRLTSGGSTNLYDALANALRDPQVEVVYLLSDGSPTKGRYTRQAQILREVAKQLRGRKVLLHTVSVGPEQPLMRELARQHGGTYRAH